MTRQHGMRRWLFACTVPVALCPLVLPAGARAQAVDYGTLEQVFGEPITTSVTGKPQRASEVPGDLTIITQDDIRRSGATDIPSILQFVTGIDVRQYTFGDAQVGIRGYDAPLNARLLVLVDGRQVYLDDEGYVAWNTIPVQLSEIRQIEIVKGPASALFGFNAASGVINIVTYDPLLDKVNTATVRGGTQGYGEGEAVATQHFGTTAGVRVSVGGWTATGYDQPSPQPSMPSPRYGSFNIDGRWQVDSNILLRAEGGDTDAHSERFLPTDTPISTQNQVNFWRLGGAAATGFGTVDLDLYRNQALDNYANGTSKNNDYVAKLTDLLKLGSSNTIRIGLEYRNNAITSIANYGGTVSYQNFAANGMWDWQISPMVDFTNAARLDHLDLHFVGVLPDIPGRTIADYNRTTLTEVSFNSGLVIKATPVDTIRVTLARGLQLPSLINFGFNIAVPGFSLLGSPNVHPTSVWNAELAYDRSIQPIGATLTAALYFQRNTDLAASPGAAPFTYSQTGISSEVENVGASNEIGLEVGLRGTTAGGFRWNASYRYTTITDDIIASAAAVRDPNTSYTNGTPRHTVIFGGGYTIQRWEFDAEGRWQSSFVDFGAYPIFTPLVVKNYLTANGRVGYRVTNYLTVAGTAQQFDDARIRESSGVYVDRRFIASATVKF